MNMIRDIWTVLTPSQRRGSVGLLGWMLLSMFFEMLGVGLMLPALTVMSGAPRTADSHIVRTILDFLGNPSPARMIVWGLVALLFVYAIKALVVLVATWRQTKFVRRLEKAIGERLLSTYMTQPWEFHLHRNSAELIRNMTNVGLFADVSTLLLNILAEFFVLFGICVVLVLIDPLASILVGSLAALSTWLLDRLTKERTSRWGGIKQHHQALSLRAIQEGLGGIKDAKVLACEKYFLQDYSRQAAVLAAVSERNAIISVVPRLWHELLGVTSLCLLALVMLWQGSPPSALIPTLGVFGAAAFRMLPSVHRVSMAVHSLRFTSELSGTIAKELALESQHLPSVPPAPVVLDTSIDLVNVTYRYARGATDALHDVNVRIPYGSAVGIIGSSGAGKSTLVDVVLGLLSPTRGNVLVDGKDVFTNVRGWQSTVGYVPQTIYLCDDTIRANVAFGIPRDRIDDAAVARAIRAAQLDEFLASLPDGLDTLVGERGVRLSGGQRQRIGMARALYHDPQVLVLDEATSALDSETEKGIMEAVDALHGTKTLIIVAHRLTTVARCDLVYRLHDGRVVQSGSFTEVVSA